MITIKVTTYNGKPLAEPLAAEFHEAGGTIGRAPGNALVLPDPDRMISRAHAMVYMRDGRFRLRDQGSASPTSVNGHPIGSGRDVPIDDGDEVQIGRYSMIVEDMDATHSRRSDDADATGTLPPGAVLASERISTFIVPPPTAAEAQPPRADTVAPPAPHAALDGGATLPLRKSPSPGGARTSVSYSDEELMRAFLAGAGIPGVEIPGGLSPQLMYQLGQLLRESTRGMLDLLLARAATKREVRAEMTIIVAQDNNPLKFSPNVDAALAALLTPRGLGFMPPLRAVRDAYEGLSSHQQGFVAGMRAVLDVVLARFNPADFERRIEQSMTDSLLPMNRKAKLWDQFNERYGELAQQAAADFHTLFGQEFLRAYDAQIARLRETGEHNTSA